MNDFKEFIKILREKDLYPDLHIIEGSSTDPEVIVDGRKILLFASNNYLGVSGDVRVKLAIKNAVDKYGMGSGGSRLLSGNVDIHNKLEKRIAEYKKTESAINFLSGYMANTGAIPAFLKVPNFSFFSNIKKIFRGDSAAVFSDELNHASIVDGCRLSKVDLFIYKHKDVQDLEKKLRLSKAKSKLVVTDGVFSMDGDIAPVDKLVALSKKYNALLMVDDAHASGILGNSGGGTPEHFNVEGQVDIIMGTYTKSFGGIGGFIAGSKELVDYLRISARSYIFSAPIAPSISAGLIEAIDIVEKESFRRESLLKNVEYLRNGLKKQGFDILGETQIIPVIIGKDEDAINISRKLFKSGIFAPAVRWPAVQKNKSRIRLTVMSTHTKDQIDRLIDSMKSL